MGVVLESDSDDEEKKETKKIVEKEEEESEVRSLCPPLCFYFLPCFTLRFVNIITSLPLLLLLRGEDTFENVAFAHTHTHTHTHSLSLSLSLSDALFLSLDIVQEEAESTDEEEEEDEQPKKKKQKKDKKSKKKKADSDSENSDVIDDLSGDEVDASLIIPGGRSTRSTRPVFTKQMYAAANLDDESEDEE